MTRNLNLARSPRVAAVLALTLSLTFAGLAPADSVTVGAAKDNTLYQEQFGSLSNGAGQHLFAGMTNQEAIRRGLIAFDIAGSIPAGARIDSVMLTLNMSRTIVGDVPVGLHPVLADWGEAGSEAFGEEGFGGPAETGDATWIHTFYDTQYWTNDGGDFDPTASATIMVGSANGTYTWGSTAQLVADVQGWLDDPSTNFGWLLLADESTFPTAKRFDTRENDNPAVRPMLTIEFTPCPADLTDDGTTNMPDGEINIFDLLLLLQNWNTAGAGADIAKPNDIVDVFDLVALLAAWETCDQG